VVGFFAAGFGQLGAQGRVAAGQGLAGVKRLGAHLAHMVHPHQRPGPATLGIAQLQLGHRSGGVGPTGAGLGPEGAQGAVGRQNQVIHHGHSLNSRAVAWDAQILACPRVNRCS